MALLDVVHDGLVEVVSADAHRLEHDDPAERDHRHLAGAAADVDDHVPNRLLDVDARADRCRDRLLDQLHAACTGRQRGLDDRALLDVGDSRRRAHHDAWMRKAAVVHPADEVPQHLLGDLEVCDHAVAQRADRGDGCRRATDHALRVVTDGVYLARRGVDGDDGWLRHAYSLATHVNERVGCAEIDRHVAAPDQPD
jgi:hypothetical protein